MRKLLFIITVILFCGTVSAQYFPVTPTTYGGNNLRGKFSVALLFPTGTGAPASLTNTSVDVTQAAFYFDKTAGKGYVWNPTTAQWDGVFGSGISNVWKQVNDTVSLVSSPYKKIGINTPSPQAVFHVKSNDLNDQIIVQNMNTSGQSAYQYRDNSGETFRANIRATGFGNTGFTAYPGIGYDVMSNFKTDDGIIPDKVFAESLIRNTTIITRYTDRWGGTGGAKQFLHERYDSSGGVTYRNNKQNGDTYIKGTLTNDNLSASKVAVSDGTKALTSSAVNTTELAQLIGISTASTIQTQLNAKGAGTVINVSATSLSSNLAMTVTGPTGNVAITALVSPNPIFSTTTVQGQAQATSFSSTIYGNRITSSATTGYSLDDGATIGWKFGAGGAGTINGTSFSRGINTLMIGTDGGGGAIEKIVGYSAGYKTTGSGLFAWDVAGDTHYEYMSNNIFSGKMSIGGLLTFTSNAPSFVSGSMGVSATSGLALIGKTGSSYDFYIGSGVGDILRVPTGTININLPSLGTGTVQSIGGTLSVISDGNVKNKYGRLKTSAVSLIKGIPLPQFWKFNEKSGMGKDAMKIMQFGLLADSVYSSFKDPSIGEVFAPTQPKQKGDSVAMHGLADRALLSLAIQSIQELNTRLEALEAKTSTLEKLIKK